MIYIKQYIWYLYLTSFNEIKFTDLFLVTELIFKGNVKHSPSPCLFIHATSF